MGGVNGPRYKGIQYDALRGDGRITKLFRYHCGSAGCPGRGCGGAQLWLLDKRGKLKRLATNEDLNEPRRAA